MKNRESRICRGTIKKSMIFGMLGALALSMTACGNKATKDLSENRVKVESSKSADKTKDIKKPDAKEKKDMNVILDEKPKKDATADSNKQVKEQESLKKPLTTNDQNDKKDASKDQAKEKEEVKKQEDKKDTSKDQAKEKEEVKKQEDKKDTSKDQKEDQKNKKQADQKETGKKQKSSVKK